MKKERNCDKQAMDYIGKEYVTTDANRLKKRQRYRGTLKIKRGTTLSIRKFSCRSKSSSFLALSIIEKFSNEAL